jgi:hypothetical protein
MMNQAVAQAYLSERPYFELQQGKVMLRDEALIAACQQRDGLRRLAPQSQALSYSAAFEGCAALHPSSHGRVG